MDADHPSETPEWRPNSALTGHAPAESTSSATQSPYLTVPRDHIGSPPSSESEIMPLIISSGIEQTACNIAPLQVSICDRLTLQIRQASTEKPDSSADPPLATLEETLKQAATTIRYNAKWFAEAALTTLVQTTLDVVASSSTSVDLLAALHLVDTVMIYSLIPDSVLPQIVRFLCQTYYGATRAYKTKRLADSTWLTLQHILESHLGIQTILALLEVISCREEGLIETKTGYAQVAGGLMIISEKLLLRGESRNTMPIPSGTDLIDSLWFTVFNGNDNIREAIMEILSVLLTEDRIVDDLDALCSWDVLLSTISPCVTLTPNVPGARSLVDNLSSRIDRFESRHLPTIANLAVEVDLPLNTELSQALLAPSDDVLPVREIPNTFCRLIEKLVRSTHYVMDLEMLLDQAVVDIFLRRPEQNLLEFFVKFLQDLAAEASTTDDAADVLAGAIVKMFRHAVRFTGRDWEKRALFQALCKMSTLSIPAADALFRIRADSEGAVYVESGLLSQAFPAHSTVSSVSAVMHDASSLALREWHDVLLGVIQGTFNWKIYRYFLTELSGLLGNHTMFTHRLDVIQRLRKLVCTSLDTGQYPEPPAMTGYTKSYVTAGLVQVLTAVLSYHRKLSKQDTMEIVSTFVKAAGSRDHVASTPCIHALTICCYELPDLMGGYMDSIIDKMSKMVTQRHLAIHVLLFLSSLSLHPHLFHNFQTRDYKKIFGVCGSYLQSIRGINFATDAPQTLSDQSSGTSADSTEALPLHVYALAHHTMAFWYLALKAQDRKDLKDYIVSCLRYRTPDGQEVVEDQGLVTIDLMDQTDTKSPQTPSSSQFEHQDGRVSTRHRLSGMFLLTTETAYRTRKTILTVRRPTGTNKWSMTPAPTSGGVEVQTVRVTLESGTNDYIGILPDDMGSNSSGRIYIPSPSSLLGSKTVLDLSADENINRAIQSFDRTPALDCHKAGVIYIGEAQTREDVILQNCMGSPDYVEFVMSLGDLMKLKGATFNTQGLDRMDDADGQHAIVWHGQVTELVFHITTLMPNNEDISLNTANKKRHIGNDFVNTVFNNSGVPFDFDTFPSQFNLVYIVITPTARTSFMQTRQQKTTLDKKDRFYAVQVLTKPGYPAISSAVEEKIISGTSLPGYIRNLALNECIFSQLWAYRDEPGEYPSSWRSRLHQIGRLRERYGT